MYVKSQAARCTLSAVTITKPKLANATVVIATALGARNVCLYCSTKVQYILLVEQTPLREVTDIHAPGRWCVRYHLTILQFVRTESINTMHTLVSYPLT